MCVLFLAFFFETQTYHKNLILKKGEEFGRGARLWTHGYDFYTPTIPVEFFFYDSYNIIFFLFLFFVDLFNAKTIKFLI